MSYPPVLLELIYSYLRWYETAIIEGDRSNLAYVEACRYGWDTVLPLFNLTRPNKALIAAAQNGRLSTLRLLFARHKINVAHIFPYAVQSGSPACIALFQVSPSMYCTAANVAARYGHVALLFKYIKLGARELDRYMCSAASTGQLRVIAQLYNRYPIVQYVNAMYSAIEHNQIGSIKLLLRLNIGTAVVSPHLCNIRTLVYLLSRGLGINMYRAFPNARIKADRPMMYICRFLHPIEWNTWLDITVARAHFHVYQLLVDWWPAAQLI